MKLKMSKEVDLGKGADRTLVVRTGSAFYYLTGGQCTL